MGVGFSSHLVVGILFKEEYCVKSVQKYDEDTGIAYYRDVKVPGVRVGGIWLPWKDWCDRVEDDWECADGLCRFSNPHGDGILGQSVAHTDPHRNGGAPIVVIDLSDVFAARSRVARILREQWKIEAEPSTYVFSSIG